MRFEQINYVLEIAKAGSISKAAKNLLLTQPNLSTALKLLEEEVGFEIFERKNSGMVITEKGHELLMYANVIKETINSINSINNTHNNDVLHELKISSEVYSFTFEEFMNIYEECKSGKINFVYKQASCVQVIQDVFDKYSNLGIITISNDIFDFVKSFLYTKGMNFTILSQSNMCLFVLENHPLWNNTKVSLDDLVNHTIVTYSHDEYFLINDRKHYFNSLAKIKNKIFVSDYASLISVMKKANAATFLMKFDNMNCKLFEDFNLNYKCFDINAHKVTCGLIHRDDYNLSSIEKKFVDYLQNALHK